MWDSDFSCKDPHATCNTVIDEVTDSIISIISEMIMRHDGGNQDKNG